MLDPAREPWLRPRAAYIHVPFCAHHCAYCDFAVATGAERNIDLYLESLEVEMASLGRPHPVETVFIGGGTPTHLSPRQLERLIELTQRWLPGATEFSIETTPESIDREKLALLAAGGVNRVSVGAQSFDPRTLRALDRRHSAEDVERAVRLVAAHFDNWSLDLIFGVPGQMLADWLRDLEQAVGSAPPHVSTYGLTYEKGTPLWKDRERGLVQPVGEEVELAMYLSAIDRLAAAGLEQYEVSNHARPGWECRHNQIYWANFAYLGFGVGAARYVAGRRELNTRDLTTYLRRTLSGESPTFQTEQLDPRARAFETIAVQLRRRRGIDRASFAAQTGFELNSLAGERINRLAEQELICDDGRSIALTRRGLCLADSVIADLLAGP